MSCLKCGAEIAANHKFCVKCGTAATSTVTPVADSALTAEKTQTTAFIDFGAELVVTGGPDVGRRFQLTKPRVTIGRAGGRANDVELSDQSVSREHARIFYDATEKAFSLINESTTNPARANGNVLGGALLLRHSDEIQLGSTSLSFVLSENAPTVRPTVGPTPAPDTVPPPVFQPNPSEDEATVPSEWHPDYLIKQIMETNTLGFLDHPFIRLAVVVFLFYCLTTVIPSDFFRWFFPGSVLDRLFTRSDFHLGIGALTVSYIVFWKTPQYWAPWLDEVLLFAAGLAILYAAGWSVCLDCEVPYPYNYPNMDFSLGDVIAIRVNSAFYGIQQLKRFFNSWALESVGLCFGISLVLKGVIGAWRKDKNSHVATE